MIAAIIEIDTEFTINESEDKLFWLKFQRGVVKDSDIDLTRVKVPAGKSILLLIWQRRWK